MPRLDRLTLSGRHVRLAPLEVAHAEPLLRVADESRATYDLQPVPESLPVPNGPDVLEIGWTWYAQRVQRTGVNTEAKLLLCTHAFEGFRVRRVSWKTDARNARSRAAILRLGARFDGVLRAHKVSPSDGAVRDTAFYSMLPEEWPAAKRALEARLAAFPVAG